VAHTDGIKGRRRGIRVIAPPEIAPGRRNFKIAASATAMIRPWGDERQLKRFFVPAIHRAARPGRYIKLANRGRWRRRVVVMDPFDLGFAIAWLGLAYFAGAS
jgi:hypothetical protein